MSEKEPNFLDMACFTSVMEMDQKIKEYERQAKLMEQQYGFSEDIIENEKQQEPEDEEEEEMQKPPPQMTKQSTLKPHQQSFQKSNFNKSNLQKSNYYSKTLNKTNQKSSYLQKLEEIDKEKQKSLVRTYNKEEQRYKNLTNVNEIEPTKSFKIKPQISEKWKKMSEDAPDPLKFYDETRFVPAKPAKIELNVFDSNHMGEDYICEDYNEYMENFALKWMEGIEE